MNAKVLFECLLVASENAGILLNTEKASAKNMIDVQSNNESDEEDEPNFIQHGVSNIVEGWMLTMLATLTTVMN